MKIKFKTFSTIILIIICTNSWAQNHANEQNISIDFNDESLENALLKIIDRYQIAIAFDNSKVKKYVVSVTFTDNPIMQVLQNLASLAHMEVRLINDVYVFNPSSNKTKFSLVTISSKVEDINSREPLPYALVYSPETNTFASTNIQGLFTLLNIPDTALLQISYLGYKDTTVIAHSINGTIKLKPNPSLLKEIVVNDQGSTTISFDEETSKISLNPMAVERLPVLGGSDIFRALQMLPGISGTNETFSGLVIRGNSPDKSLVLLDGYSLYHVDHFYGIYSSFNSKAIKNIQLYKGGFSSKYGGRTSSVLLLSSKDGNQTKFSGDIGVNLVDVNAVLEMPINNKLTFLIAVRRSLTDVIENYLFKELYDKAAVNSGDLNNASSLDYTALNPEFNFGDLNFKTTYRPTKTDHLSLSFYLSMDNLSYEYETIDEDVLIFTSGEQSRWGNVGISTIWAKKWNSKFTSQAQIAFSTYYSNTSLQESYVYHELLGKVDEKYINAQENNVIDFSIKIDNQYITSKNSILKYGIATTNNSINLTSIINENESPVFNQDGFQAQLYGDYTFNFNQKFKSTIGVRSNYFDFFNKIYFEPKLNLKYDATNWLTFKGAWGQNNQMISRILRLDLFTSNPDFWMLSNHDVPVMHSNQIAVGAHLNFDFATIDIEGFASKTVDEAEYVPRLRNFDTEETSLDQPYAIGNNTTQGLELLIEKGEGNYYGLISYTLSSSLNLFKTINGGNAFPSRFDQRHEIKLVNMYKFGDLDFSLNWIFGSGKPYSAPEGVYTITTLDGSKITNAAYSVINNKRLPDYHRLDISATYNIMLGKTKAKIGLSIFNVYNRENIKYRRFGKIRFDKDGSILNNDKFIVTDITLLGVTPSVFINWSF